MFGDKDLNKNKQVPEIAKSDMTNLVNEASKKHPVKGGFIGGKGRRI